MVDNFNMKFSELNTEVQLEIEFLCLKTRKNLSKQLEQILQNAEQEMLSILSRAQHINSTKKQKALINNMQSELQTLLGFTSVEGLSKPSFPFTAITSDYSEPMSDEMMNSSSADEPKSDKMMNSSNADKPKVKGENDLLRLYLKYIEWLKNTYGEEEVGNGHNNSPASLENETVEHESGLRSASSGSGCVDALKDDPRVSANLNDSESRTAVIAKINDEKELQMNWCSNIDDMDEGRYNFTKPECGPCTAILVPTTNPCEFKVIQQQENGLFSVQRVEQLKDLLELEKTMLSFYLEERGKKCPFLRQWDLINNGFYALYHTKMKCYIRVKFSGNPTSGDYIPSICLIDYGQYEMLASETLNQSLHIRPLKKCFISLPMQGYTASPASGNCESEGVFADRRGYGVSDLKGEGEIVRANVLSYVKEHHSTFPHLKLQFI